MSGRQFAAILFAVIAVLGAASALAYKHVQAAHQKAEDAAFWSNPGTSPGGGPPDPPGYEMLRVGMSPSRVREVMGSPPQVLARIGDPVPTDDSSQYYDWKYTLADGTVCTAAFWHGQLYSYNARRNGQELSSGAQDPRQLTQPGEYGHVGTLGADY